MKHFLLLPILLLAVAPTAWAQMLTPARVPAAARATSQAKFPTVQTATWPFESYRLCDPIYAEAAQNTTFDYRYYPAHDPTVEQRLVPAGIRLAGALAALGG